MGKHYSIEFKHRIAKSSNRQIVKSSNRRHSKPRKAKMPKRKDTLPGDNPQDIKTLLKRMEYLETENAILKKFKELNEQKARQKRNIKPNNDKYYFTRRTQ